jgi:hypothetical protein
MEALKAFLEKSVEKLEMEWQPRPRDSASLVNEGSFKAVEADQGSQESPTKRKGKGQTKGAQKQEPKKTRSVEEMQKDVLQILEVFCKGGEKRKVLKTKDFWKLLTQHEAGRLDFNMRSRELDMIFLDALRYLDKGTRGEISMEEFLNILDKHLSKHRVEEVRWNACRARIACSSFYFG